MASQTGFEGAVRAQETAVRPDYAADAADEGAVRAQATAVRPDDAADARKRKRDAQEARRAATAPWRENAAARQARYRASAVRAEATRDKDTVSQIPGADLGRTPLFSTSPAHWFGGL